MRSLVSLHRKRWNGLSNAFRSANYMLFHERLSELFLDRGWVRLFSLEAGKRPLAHLYCFAYSGRYYYYQAGRDPDYAKYRVGLLLMHHAIQAAINEGASTFDFLSGEEEYKYRWSTSTIQNLCFQHWKTLPARLIGAAADVVTKVTSDPHWPRPPLSRRWDGGTP
jgi:CelD/BcsL family acetyltransferase involved in cellulose biosynthesis